MSKVKLIDIIENPLSGEWGTDDDTGKGIPVLRTTNFTNEGIINYDSVVTRTIKKKNISEKYLVNGDIIIEKSGGSDKQPVGRVVYFDNEENKFLFNNFTGLLRVKDKSKWNPRFVFYSLYYNYQIGGTQRYQNKTTGLHNLKTDQYIKDFEIKDFQIQQQENIVVVLDRVLQLIQLQQQELEKLDELIKSRFVEMFGDSDYPILNWNDVFYTTTGKLDSNAMEEDGKYPFFTCAKEVSRINTYAFDEEALLLAGNNAAGKYDVKHYCGKFNAYQRTYVLTLKQDWSYVLFQHQLEDKLEYLQNQSLGGLTKYLTLKILGELEFIVPPVEIQSIFADFVAQIEKQKETVKKSLEKLETLKKSLMQEYFG